MHPCERYKLEAHTPPLNDVRSLLYSLASSSTNSKSDEKGLLYSSSSLQRYRTTVYSTVRDGDHHQFITSLGSTNLSHGIIRTYGWSTAKLWCSCTTTTWHPKNPPRIDSVQQRPSANPIIQVRRHTPDITSDRDTAGHGAMAACICTDWSKVHLTRSKKKLKKNARQREKNPAAETLTFLSADHPEASQVSMHERPACNHLSPAAVRVVV